MRRRRRWRVDNVQQGRPNAKVVQSGATLPISDPDRGVVVTDDVLVPSVTANPRGAGTPYPKVLALANFPAVPQTHVPTCFLGHDIETLFDRCAASLHDPEAQRTCPVFPIPAVFEDEWRQKAPRRTLSPRPRESLWDASD